MGRRLEQPVPNPSDCTVLLMPWRIQLRVAQAMAMGMLLICTLPSPCMGCQCEFTPRAAHNGLSACQCLFRKLSGCDSTTSCIIPPVLRLCLFSEQVMTLRHRRPSRSQSCDFESSRLDIKTVQHADVGCSKVRGPRSPEEWEPAVLHESLCAFYHWPRAGLLSPEASR